MKKKYYIGCSGYYYPSWKNSFYPKEVKQQDFLKYYSSVFNSVELNGTFYRQPHLKALRTQAKATPADFRFSVKMSRYITHNHKLRNSRKLIKDFQDLILNGLENKPSCFLFQMPSMFHYSEENLNRILEMVPHQKENIFEFRHASWWNEKAEREFKKAKLTLCNVDFPGLETSTTNTSPFYYLRLHGKPHVFTSSYNTKSLENFVENFPENCRSYFIYFNNTDAKAAFKNAQQIVRMINK